MTTSSTRMPTRFEYCSTRSVALAMACSMVWISTTGSGRFTTLRPSSVVVSPALRRACSRRHWLWSRWALVKIALASRWLPLLTEAEREQAWETVRYYEKWAAEEDTSLAPVTVANIARVRTTLAEAWGTPEEG